MPKSETLYHPQNVISITKAIVTGTSFIAANPLLAPTNTILIASANANDSVIKELTISSNDTASATVQFWISPDGGTTKFLKGTVVVAALSGAATLINVDVLGNATLTGLELDEGGRPMLRLQGSGTPVQLYAGVINAAVTANKAVYITGTQVEM